MTTAPRLRALEPDATVHRARLSGAGPRVSWGIGQHLRGVVVAGSDREGSDRAGSDRAGLGRTGSGWTLASAEAEPPPAGPVVKWRSSRRRSSAPVFQIA